MSEALLEAAAEGAALLAAALLAAAAYTDVDKVLAVELA